MTTAPTSIELGTDLGTEPSSTTAPLGGWLIVGGLAAASLSVGAARVVRSLSGARPGWIVASVLIAAWIAAGVALLRRACPLGRLALVAAVSASVAYVGFAQRAIDPTSSRSVGDVLAVVGLAALPAVGLHVLIGLPDGRLLSRPRRVLVGSGYALAAVAAVTWLAGSRSGGGWLVASGSALAVAVGVVPANQRYRETAGVTRQRLQWIGCAVAFTGETALVVVALHLLVGWPERVALVAGAASVAIPVAMLVSATPLVSRVDRLLVTTVSFTGLTGVVVAVYLVIVVGLGPSASPDQHQLLVLSMVAAGVAALLYVPARARLTEQANRLVYGERYAPDEALQTFGNRLSRAVPMDELLLQLAESLRKTMALHRAEVWTGTDGVYELAVSVPDRTAHVLRVEATALPVVARAGVSGTAWVQVWLPTLVADRDGHQLRVAPIAHSGQLLGLVVLDRPADGDSFTEADDQALGDLVRQVALALHNVNLDSALQASLDDVRRYATQLQESRARIVASGDAERRKIERNLHDGAQQHLVALAVNLRLVRDLVADNPDASEMLEMLADSVKDTIQEVRDLAHGIYPPLLMDSGLPEALRAAGARSPLDVDVDAAVARYTTDIEAAVYFCCLEAMQNAAKHAPGARLWVRVWEDDDGVALRFAVHDDGPGFDPAAATSGHGYVNMSDRLGAIGGTVSWTSVAGEGATIEGRLPIRL